MSRRVLLIIGSVVAIAAIAGGLWFWFAPENYETTNVNDQVERLSLDNADSADADTEAEAAVESADADTDADAAVESAEADADTEATGDAIVFSIDTEQSTAEFNIDENLRGERVTVVGTTNQVAGDISIDVNNPANSEIGQILINARDLQTDETGRNRALRNFILESANDEYEFITFDPASISGMPGSVSVGDTFEFQVMGDLTIKDTTQEVTFDVTVTPNSEAEIEGSAQTTIAYADFGLVIPEVPFVANVEDEVTLIFNFVAVDEQTTTARSTSGLALMMGGTRRDIAQDEPEATEDPMMEATEEMMATEEAVAAGPITTEDGLLVTAVVFSIDSERSVAEFNIDEDLRGERVTVVGTTDQVAGDFLVDLVDTSNTQVGQILINARDLQTDASGRNRALRNFILESSNDEFEFITFNPTSLDGLPEAVGVGQEFTFQVTGDLTIKGVTREVIFDITLSADSVEEITGTAETVVLWRDFDLAIPDVPFVANINDEVVLRFNFTATAVEIGTAEPDEVVATEEAPMEATEEATATEEAG